jgi:hypothetical protein
MRLATEIHDRKLVPCANLGLSPRLRVIRVGVPEEEVVAAELGLAYNSKAPALRRAPAVVRIGNGQRAAWEEALKMAGVPSVVYYPKPLHLHTAFAPLSYRAGDFPESERASAEVLSLPFGPYLDSGGVAPIAAVRCASVGEG